ncbi:chaplin [Streptomyces sp. WMMB 322]|uniref:chaplin n=1 Tax=Streptomyces sp. WMMB 322 TaxID=1286821 RepID=UPI0006E2AADF|nr:chaplin [Streptomyces sp. WMMB 322]SCK53929.1 Small secreted domain [Streptomyces sp. WMMB 322]
MRQVTRKGLITVAAAGGVLATFSGGTAFADSAVQGTAGNSGGVLSGNNVQAPISAPINVCGNTVTVLGALNSASGTSCGGGGSTSVSGSSGNSEGIGSGNNIQAPIDVPVNVCGNGINAVGEGSPASADCGGGAETTPPGDDGPDNPGPDDPGPDNPGPDNPGPDNPGPDNPGPDNPGGSGDDTPTSDVRTQSEPMSELAQTGAGEMIGIGVPLSAGLLVGGFVLYRRAARLAQR